MTPIYNADGSVRNLLESEYLRFTRNPGREKKTKIYVVCAIRTGEVLGTIKWYGSWRQYTFAPRPETIFNKGCLSEINIVLTALMEERKKEKAA